MKKLVGERLQEIINALALLWSDAAEKRCAVYLPPAPHPDFNTLQECMDSVKWDVIEPVMQQRVLNIREALHALRDEVSLSEFILAFDPLQGHGLKYDQPSGLVKFHRYRGAQDLIDMAGEEVQRVINLQNGTTLIFPGSI